MPQSMPALSHRTRKLGVLWALYFVQGLPYGFQISALPIYLRESGVTLTQIGLASALSLPWLLKVLWAPLVDRYSSPHLGRRRTWILPLQICLALACVVASRMSLSEGLTPIVVMVLLMNLFAATMDIAVDGLAVDLLDADELGKGNVAQVVGYKIGILVGGGLLVWASGWIGWEGLFLVMAGLVALSLPVTFLMSENRLLADAGREVLENPGFRALLSALRRAISAKGALWLFLFIATYKLGESMADTMFRPFLVDAGFAREQIGLWVGTWGMVFSILGSVAGGYLATRLPLLNALAVAAALRVLPIAGEWWLSLVTPTSNGVIAVTCAEQFFGGALTTTLFAFMMSRVNRHIGATHYTLLASVEVWGKLVGNTVSGKIADLMSYPFVFGLATVLSALFLLLLLPLRQSQTEEQHPS